MIVAEQTAHLFQVVDAIARLETLGGSECDASIKKLAMDRAFQLLGLAAKRVPNSMRADYPQIIWKELMQLREFRYDRLELTHLLNTVVNELPPIKNELVSLLSKIKE